MATCNSDDQNLIYSKQFIKMLFQYENEVYNYKSLQFPILIVIFTNFLLKKVFETFYIENSKRYGSVTKMKLVFINYFVFLISSAYVYFN